MLPSPVRPSRRRLRTQREAPTVAMPEVGDWDGWGMDDGPHSVHVSSRGCSAEEAVGQLIQRAHEKYGVGLNLKTWRFWLREVGPTVQGQSLHYRFDEGGRLVRTDR